jgi:hypothetical protein
MLIRILIKVIGICDYWFIDHLGLHFESPGLHCERPRLYVEPLKLMNFYFTADPDPASKTNADLDPDVHPGQIPSICPEAFVMSLNTLLRVKNRMRQVAEFNLKESS